MSSKITAAAETKINSNAERGGVGVGGGHGFGGGGGGPRGGRVYGGAVGAYPFIYGVPPWWWYL